MKSLTLVRNINYRESYTMNFETNDYNQEFETWACLTKIVIMESQWIIIKSTYPFFTFVLAPDFDIMKNDHNENMSGKLNFGSYRFMSSSLDELA